MPRAIEAGPRDPEQDQNQEKQAPIEVKKFSKEYSGGARQETAKEIKALRKEHFTDKMGVGERISNLLFEMENKSVTLDCAEQKVADIQTKLQGYADSKVKAFFGYFKKRLLEKELEAKSSQKNKLKKDSEELLDILQHLQTKFSDKSRLEAAKNKIREFYAGQEQQLEEYEREEKARDVKSIIQKHNCLFVHGIKTIDTPDVNSLVSPGVDWETKMKIALSLDPTLSSSTVKRGDNLSAYWSNVGILLKGGRVETAAPRDNATVAQSIKHRKIWGVGDKKEDIDETIDISIHQRRQGNRYNEFTVAGPVPAGLYLAYDNPKKNSSFIETAPVAEQKDMPHERLCAMAKYAGLPVYIIVDGVPYEAIYNEQEKKFDRGKELTLADILENNAKVDESDKARMLENIFENSPFKKTPEDVLLASAFQYGKGFYVRLMHDSLKNSGVETVYKKPKGAEYSQITNGAKISELCSVVNVGVTTKYLHYQGELYDELSYLRAKPWRSKFVQRKFDGWDLKKGWIGNMGGKHPVTNVEDYLSVMTGEIESRRQDVVKSRAANRPDLVRYDESGLKGVASHICGFAEQAGAFGDIKTKEMALKLVGGIISPEELNKIVARRIGPKGELKITAEDLP